MSKKQEELLRQLTDQVLRLAWKIADKKNATCHDQQLPLMKVARDESIKTFHCSALALRAILKLETGHASASSTPKIGD
jgi:hypothetical protein